MYDGNVGDGLKRGWVVTFLLVLRFIIYGLGAIKARSYSVINASGTLFG